MLQVNGESHLVSAPPATSLLEVLRDHIGLTGTKEACGRGECGTCTVLLNGQSILSCIATFDDIAGPISTIEGVADANSDLRAAFADFGAFQCGYCTPGQIVRAVALLNEQWPDDVQAIEAFVRHAMSGNICRCTGYVGIVDAIIHTARMRGKIRTQSP
jgi:aerobic-type carbon monoxide dehydrogenase small subunit (CoxS/CutS family)